MTWEARSAEMKFTIRDLMFVILAAGLHFGLVPWLRWNMCVPLIVAFVAAIGLSRPPRSIMFSCAVGALACLASTTTLTVQAFQVPFDDRHGMTFSENWDVILSINAIIAAVGAGIGAFVGFMMKPNSPATHY